MEDKVKKMIEKNVLALATVDNNNNPHNIAIASVKVISNNQLLITDNYMEETIENIKSNNNAALVFWKEEGYELRGTAEYFTEGKWFEKIKQLPENKDMPCKGAILVTINKIKKLS